MVFKCPILFLNEKVSRENRWADTPPPLYPSPTKRLKYHCEQLSQWKHYGWGGTREYQHNLEGKELSDEYR
jgi:hypothetical protein